MPNKTFPPNAKAHKVKIPMELFSNIISLLEEIDIDSLCPDTIQLYGYVRYALNKKKNGMHQRGPQTGLFNAPNGPFCWDAPGDMAPWDDDGLELPF